MQYYAAINRSDALITGQCGRTLGDSVTGNIQNRKIWRQKVDWWLPGFVGLDRGGVNATKFFFFFFFGDGYSKTGACTRLGMYLIPLARVPTNGSVYTLQT